MLKRLTIPSLLIMLSTGAHALTLGQIHVHSFINQPLKATIDLQGVKANELTALNIKLASRTDFKKAGVDWDKQLEGLKFSIIQSNKGPAIRVTSRQAVSEPFLSFVVDAKWANGKMIKDFTLLLDPPLYSGKLAAPVDVAGAARVTDKPQLQPEDSGPQQQAAAQPPVTETSQVQRKSDSTLQTMTGTTLWQVASRSRPADATMQQTMVAIHEENPESFIRGNMNLLKKGQLLRIPSAEVIRGIPRSAANQRMTQHEKAMRSRKAITSSERLSPEITAQATEAAESPAQQEAAPVTSPPVAESGGRLRLDSAADDVNEETMRGDQAPPAGTDLAADAAGGEENRALRSRVELLEEQLRVAHKLIQMKGELAQLQQLYRQIDAQKPQADAGQAELTDEQLLLLSDAAEKTVAEEPDQGPLSAADDLSMKDEELAAIDPEQQAAADADEDVVSPEKDAEQLSAVATAGDEDAVETDETSAEDAVTSTAKTEEEQSSAALPAATLADANIEEDAAISTPGEQQAAPPAVRRDSLIEGIDNNLLYGAGGVGVLGFLLSFLLGRRGRKKSTEPDSTHKYEAPVDESPVEKKLAGESTQSLKGDDTEPSSEAPDADETLAQQPEQESTTLFKPPEALSIDEDEPQALDPLELAAALMRNGEDRQAQDVLRQAVEADPTRMDLHMQLLESLYAKKERHAFEAEMNQLESSGISIDPDEWLKIERMHAELLPAGLDSLGVVKQKHTEAEIIDLDFGSAEESSDASDSKLISDEDSGESEAQPDSDLEEALRAFEMELEEKKSDELLSEAGVALDEAAKILDNPVTSAMPGAEIVEDLELEEDLVVDESAKTDQGIEIISLDDSFGIDSHINKDFDDVFTESTDLRAEQSDTLSLDEEDTLPVAESEEFSIASFDTDPSTLREAELDAKIDLAAAFSDMGDVDSARDILDEVISDGSEQQQQAAQELLKKYR